LNFFIQIFALYISYSLIRFIAITLFAGGQSLKENVFMTLCAPKGITVVVITLTIIAMNIGGFNELVTYILGLILLSMIVATVTARHSKFFLGVEIEEEKPKKKK